MTYYTVTLGYNDTAKTDTFTIDDSEILPFIEFICTKIPNLENFYAYKHTYNPHELQDTIGVV